ncbi:MAG: cyclopropane-fatty-acyl-phospholipid synthase family protein [Acidimicrobiales bacterium]
MMTSASRATLLALAGRIRTGTLLVSERNKMHRLGHGLPTVHVRVDDDRAWSMILRGGSRGLGEAYINGWWQTDDLVATLEIMLAAMAPTTSRLDRLTNRLSPLVDRVSSGPRSNEDVDRRNIRAHYDVSNEFFALMLDETMAYSCGIFDTERTRLAEASVAKLERVCEEIDLQPNDHVVEIGSGWGSFAIHAARRYGCRVTTATISDAQYEYTAARVKEAGLEDLIDVRNCDYRELQGRFDKLVSIEMIEAISWRDYDTYFQKCAELLRPGGRMAIQAIVARDESFHRMKRRGDFIKTFVFPDGCLPSVAAITEAAQATRTLEIVDIHDIGRHYVPTLRSWRQNLANASDEVAALGLDEPRFARLWDMYLAYCEAGFRQRYVSTVQITMRESTRVLAYASR